MARRGGRKTQIKPADFVALLDKHTTYETSGHPRRTRRCLNGRPVSENDARMIRRWRATTVKGVTAEAANALLRRYDLPIYQEDR